LKLLVDENLSPLTVGFLRCRGDVIIERKKGGTEMLHVYNRIETKPEVMLGKPVVKGTRIPVELIVRKLGEGASVEDLLDAYPNLTREDVQAALIYAADTLANETTIYLETGT
jgi:uncharacterized protein (DUF433 family)